MSAAPVIELESVRKRIAKIESMGSRALPPKLKIELERLRARQSELEGLVTTAAQGTAAGPAGAEAGAPPAEPSGDQAEAEAPGPVGHTAERPTLTLVTIDGAAVVSPPEQPVLVEASADLGAARVLAHQVQGQARGDYEIFVTRLDHFMSVRTRLEGAAMRSKAAIEEHVLWPEHLRAARAALDGLRDLERHEEAAILFAAFGDDRQQALALLRSLEDEVQAVEIDVLPPVVVEAGSDVVVVGPGVTAGRGRFQAQVIGSYPHRWYSDLAFELVDAAADDAPALAPDLHIGLLRTKDVAADVGELRERLNFVARSVPSVEVLQGLSIEVRENLTFEYDFVVKGQQHIVVVAFFRTGGRDWVYDPDIDGFRCAEQQIEGFTSDALSMLGVLVTSHGAKLEGPRKRIFMTAFFGGGSVDVSAFKSEVDVEFVWARCKPSGIPVVRGKIEAGESAFERLIRQPI